MFLMMLYLLYVASTFVIEIDFYFFLLVPVAFAVFIFAVVKDDSHWSMTGFKWILQISGIFLCFLTPLLLKDYIQDDNKLVVYSLMSSGYGLLSAMLISHLLKESRFFLPPLLILFLTLGSSLPVFLAWYNGVIFFSAGIIIWIPVAVYLRKSIGSMECISQPVKIVVGLYVGLITLFHLLFSVFYATPLKMLLEGYLLSQSDEVSCGSLVQCNSYVSYLNGSIYLESFRSQITAHYVASYAFVVVALFVFVNWVKAAHRKVR